jgi:hypothetical protein
MPFHSTFKVSDTYFREHMSDCAFHGGHRIYYKVIKRTPKTIIIKENKTGEEKRYKIRKSSFGNPCDLSYEYIIIAPHTLIRSHNCNDVCELDNYFNERTNEL